MDSTWEMIQGVALILMGAKIAWDGHKGIKPGTEPQFLHHFGAISSGEKMKPSEQTSSIGWGSAMIAMGVLFLAAGIVRLLHTHGNA